MRPDGSHLRQLTHYRGGTVHAFTGSFSPDGRSITFKASPTGGYEVYVMRANGTRVRQLTDDGTDPGGGLAGRRAEPGTVTRRRVLRLNPKASRMRGFGVHAGGETRTPTGRPTGS